MPLGVLSVDTNRLWKGKLRVGSQGESRDAALVVPQRYAEQTQHTPAPPPPTLPKDTTTPLKSSLRSGGGRTTGSGHAHDGGQLIAQRSPSIEQRRVKLAEALETHKSMEEQLADQHRLETEEERQYQAAKETQKKKEEQEKRIPPNREALSTMHDYRAPKVVLDGLRDPPPGSSQSARNSSGKSTLQNSRGNSRGDPASARGLSQDSTTSVAGGLKSLRISSGPAVIQNPLAPTREERNANRKAAAKKEAFTTGSSDDEDQDFVEGEEVRSSTADDEEGEKGVSKMIQSLKPGFTQVKLCSLPRKEGALVNPPSATTSRRTTHHTIPGSSNSGVISPCSDLGGTDSQLFSVLSQTIAFGGSTGSGGAVPGGASAAAGTYQQQSSVQGASVTSGIEVFESGRESTASAGGGGGGRYSSIGSSGTTSFSVVPPPDVRRGTVSPPQHHQHFGGAAEAKVMTDDSQSHHPFGVPGGSGVTTPEGGLGVADKNLSASNIPYRKSSSKPRFRTEGEKEAVRATMSFRRGTKLLHPQDFQNLIEASQPAVYTKIADLGMEGIPRPVEDDDGAGGASALLQQYRKEHATTRQHQRPSITGATILSQTVSPTAGDPDVESRHPQQSRGGEKRLSGPPRILTSPGGGGGPLSSSSQQTRPSTQQQSVVTITDKGEAKVLLPQQRFLKKGTRSPGSRASSRSKNGAPVVDEVKLVGLSSGSREVVLNVMEKLDTWGKSQEGYVPHRKGKLYIPGEHKVHIPKKPPSIPIKALTPRQEVLMQEKKHAFAMSQIKVAVKGVVTNSKPVMFKTPYIAADRINLIERPLQAVEDFVFRPKTVHYVHPPHSAQLESLNSRMNKKDFLSLAQKEHHQRRMDESNKVVLSLKERHALITSGSRGDPVLEELEEEKRRRRQEELNKDPIQSLIQEAKKRRAEAKRRRRDSDDDYY